MKTLYLDCGMGAAGDMLTAALLELLPHPDDFIDELNTLGIPDIEFRKSKDVKCGITGTHVSVTYRGMEEGAEMHRHTEHTHVHAQNESHQAAHAHSGLHQIEHIIGHLALPESVQNDILAVFQLLAEAESHVHNMPVSDIHFHEVGTMDAVADITAVCMLIHRLAPDEIIVSPVNAGSGHVHCAHGILPVPAPATAYLLQGIPMYGSAIQGELCTPTGAALLRHFATRFGELPVIQVEAIGYGMGVKEFDTANCVRAMIGTTGADTDMIYELACNVDDMTGEAIGFATECLLMHGALDAYTVPIGMKKSRPATMICVLCHEANRQELLSLLFQHTTTLGVRETPLHRYMLHRKTDMLHTELGDVHRKVSYGYGVSHSKYEYEDLARIAREHGKSLAEVQELLDRSYKN